MIKIQNSKFPPSRRASKIQDSFTLIEVLVGIFLITIVFFGIFNGFQLATQVIEKSKARIGALAIANQEIENIRNLLYESIGVRAGFPEGILEVSTTTRLNNIDYIIEKKVDFIVDFADGVSLPQDECPNDYKKAEVKVSWSGRAKGQVSLVTSISPKNLSQECAIIGGILSVSVLDAFGALVLSPLIEIKNPLTDLTIVAVSPETGQYYFPLATSTYKVMISKNGYSQERTYSAAEVAIPEKPNPLVLEDQLIETSFFIDRVGVFSANTFSLWGQDYFSDTFSNTDKISDSNNIVINQSQVILATDTHGYLTSGVLTSISVNPTNIIKWEEFNFSDFEPQNTDIKYRVFFASSTDWLIIPENDLAGNASGFDEGSIDLSALATGTYSQLKIKGSFSTNSTSVSPILFDWQISWRTSAATPIPGVAFNLRGTKILGLNNQENPVYKYSVSHLSDIQGQLTIPDLEWDLYNFSSLTANLDLVKTEPEPQPISLPPNINLPVNLYFQAENSLLIAVQNLTTLEPVFSAQARLSKASLGYDSSQYTDEKGQTYFIPLQGAVYNLDVSAAGYLPASTTVSVSGDNVKTIKLQQVE